MKFLSILVSKMDFFFIFRFVFYPQALGKIGHRKRLFSKTFSGIEIFEHAVKFISTLSCEKNQTALTHTGG